jgi:hypothetical protein
MKRPLIFAISAALLLFSSIARAQQGASIRSVGLAGYYSNGVPTPVRVHIPSLAASQAVHLEFDVVNRIGDGDSVVVESGHYSIQVKTRANEPLDTDIPILLVGYGEFTIRLSAKDSSGKLLGESTWKLNPKFLSGFSSAFVAIYCVDEASCEQTHAQLPIPGSQQQKAEEGSANPYISQTSPPTYAILREAADEYWAYSIANAIVISAPLRGLAPSQQTAFEDYLRRGGKLILLEEEAADPGFLAPYRNGSIVGSPIPVGKGELIRLPGLRGQSLLNYLKQHRTSESYSDYMEQITSSRGGVSLLSRLGVNFVFPRLRWMLLWFGAYILIAGLVNFTVLRRLGKLEWGWVTTCIASLAFAAALFIYSSSHKPVNFMLDEVSVYWMDSQSPRAAAEYGLRISAPERADLSISVPNDALLQLPDGNSNLFGEPNAMTEIGSEISGNMPNREDWHIESGPSTIFHPSLLRWSSQDYSLRGIREFPGTVHWTSPSHLRNDTGLTFREAVVLDRKRDKRYRIASLGPGEEVDLSSIQSVPVYDKANLQHRISTAQKYPLSANPNSGAFSLDEVPALYFGTWPANLTFIGLTDAPVLQVTVEGRTVVRHNFAFAVVCLDEQ